MSTPNTNRDVRINNRKRLFRILFKNGEMTKQEMAASLNVSLSTITNLLRDLEQKGLVTTGKLQDSTGGRKASSYIPLYDAKVSLGAEVTPGGIRIALLDLGCNLLGTEYHAIELEDTPEYWTNLDQLLGGFGMKHIQDESRLLNVGITLEETMQDGKIIQKTGHGAKLNLSKVQQYFKRPIEFRNSTKMAAVAHIWTFGDEENFVYIKLGNHIRGSLAHEGNILDFSGINGEFGEMLFPGNKKTLNSHFNISAIYQALGYTDLAAFQQAVRNQEPQALKSWYLYLDDLSVLLYNIYCIFGWKIIIGGTVSPLLGEYLDYVMDKIYEFNVFRKVSIPDIRISSLGEYGSAVGAAMLPIDRFMDL